MRVSIDGRSDIRPLDSSDIPATPLPYDDITIQASGGTLANRLNGQTGSNTFTATDWGSGLDFYLNQAMVIHKSAVAFTPNFHAQMYSRVSSFDEYYIYHTIRGGTALLHDGEWIYARIWNFPTLRRVISSDTIITALTNLSGVTISFEVYLSGIPK